MADYVESSSREQQVESSEGGADQAAPEAAPLAPNLDGPEVARAAEYAIANELLEEEQEDFFSRVKEFFTGKKKVTDPPAPVKQQVVNKVKETAQKKVAKQSSSQEQTESTTPPTTTPDPKGGDEAPPTLAEQITAKIGEGKADKAMQLLKGADPGDRTVAWAALTNDKRKALTDLLSYGTLGNGILKGLFDATPEADLKAITKLFEVRYKVSVGHSQGSGKTGVDFDAKGLKRCWEVLAGLPPEHVEGNAWLEHWTRYQAGGSAGGYYSAGRKESSMGYDPAKIDAKNNAADEDDPLYQVVRFDKVVRHEIGHAVDSSIGGSASYCIGNAGGGNWKEHGQPSLSLVKEMVTASGGAISKLKEEHKVKVVGAILKAMADGKPAETQANIRNLDIMKAGGDKKDPEVSGAELGNILGDSVVKTSETSGSGKNPWYRAPGMGVDVGGRHYQASYGTRWVSYDKSALAKKCSTYQFRAPGEWFAEAYATYFQPDGDGKIGTLLKARDGATKAWFDANVLPKEKKEVAPPEKKPEKVTEQGGDPGKKG